MKGDCPVCRGTGWLGDGSMKCGKCKGRGFAPANPKCEKCYGNGWIIYKIKHSDGLTGDYAARCPCWKYVQENQGKWQQAEGNTPFEQERVER